MTIPRPHPISDHSRLGPPPGAKIAVVGGCGGMGRAVVAALAGTGVEVAVLDLASSIAQHRPSSARHAIAIDGSDPNSVANGFAELGRAWPALDGMVNLAGFMKGWQTVAELPPELFDEVVMGNLKTHFLCARAALPLLRASGEGALVSVASTMAMDVYPGYAHYAAAKAAIVALVKGMARENAPVVRVNAVAPGLTDTAFLEGGTGRPQVFDAMNVEIYAKRVPLKRVAQPADMVGPIMFLLGRASRFMTGETMIVDGGVYLQ